MSTGVLDGVTVLDLTRVLAGPYCGMLLADMGANVIKIERPVKGDDSRQFYPMVNGESAYYMNLNRNKRGMTLDLKKEEGKQILRELVKKADILIENYRPGTMEKLGLGYEELHKINPRLVYGCVSGFGQTGPYSSRPGYDIIGQAIGGMMSVTGWPGGAPTRTGTAISDVLGGLGMTVGVLGAYVKAAKSGEGQMVDVALVDSVVSSLEIIMQIYLASGRVPERIGNRYESCYPYDSFKAADGDLVIACGNDKLFSSLTGLMGMPELVSDARFVTNLDRINNHVALKEIIEAWLSDKTIKQAVAMILAAGVPAGEINTIDRIAEDEHIAGAREMFVEVDHPKAGKMKIMGSHIKFSRDKAAVRFPAPTLGQHTDEILREMCGMDETAIDALRTGSIL